MVNNKTPHTINGEVVECAICYSTVNRTWKDSARQLQQCSNHHGFHQDCLLGWLKRHRADCTCCSCQPPVEGEQESAEWYMVLLNESCPCCRCELNLESLLEVVAESDAEGSDVDWVPAKQPKRKRRNAARMPKAAEVLCCSLANVQGLYSDCS
jgi:hypothetical protein